MKTALTCFALLVASGTTMAQQEFGLSDANVTRAVNELSGEMLECAVFFSVGAQCVRGHPDQSVPGVVSDVTQAFQDDGRQDQPDSGPIGCCSYGPAKHGHRCDVEVNGR